MSLLLAIFAIGIGASMVKEVGKDVTKIPARSKIQEDSKSGKFDVVKNFEEILFINDVKRKKFNSNVAVLPNTGYEKCLDYIRNHHLTTKADEQRFIRHYRKVLASELADRQTEYDKHYSEVKSKVYSLMGTEEFEIVKFEHINVFMDYLDVELKMDQIYNNTFFGNWAVNKPKIKERNSNSYTEIWALKIPVSMKFDLEVYYKVCAQKCGYIY